MTLHVAPRGHRDPDRAQQHADEAREAQEAAGAIHGVLDLRARFRDIAQAFAAVLVGREPGLQLLDLRALAREQHAVTHAAARLDELRGRQVLHVHEETGGEIREGTALVRPRNQDTSDAERGSTDRDLGADTGADPCHQL